MVRAALAVALLCTNAAAAADDRCAVPLADWQPKTVLQRKLEGEGWSVLRIRADDGCYKVLARDASGRTMKARFDPATLERTPGDGEHRERRGGGHDRGDD
ncbi:MAG: PepSY domain-containing protein [Siculibacillus sp.]|nr:PepSY domain-containing protein [Siculibacillus sp.]